MPGDNPLALPVSVDAPLLVHGDCTETLRRLPDACVHLVVIDPPYFRVKGEAWDRQWDSAAGFLAWLGGVLDEIRRVLAANGSLYMFASPQMSARVECLTAEHFAVLSSIVWAKPCPFSAINYGAGNSGRVSKQALRAYYPNTERITFAEQLGADLTAMGESGYDAKCATLRGSVFEPLRAYIANEWAAAGLTFRDLNEATDSQMAWHYLTSSQWALPTAPVYAQMQERANRDSDGHLRREYEHLRREYEDLRREYGHLRREYEDLRRPFNVSATVPYTDVWTYPTVAHYPGKHPCEKPAAMIDDMIRASSRPGDIVLDCFLGSGATIERAVRLGRLGIGVEIGDYIHGARRRIAQAIGTREAAAVANAVAPTGAQFSLF